MVRGRYQRRLLLNVSLREVPRSFCDRQRRSNLVFVMNKQYYVYILTNKSNRVLYTGVTNDLKRRVYEHKTKIQEGFTKKYNVDKLVYFEFTNDINAAILREKQIKGGSRQKKIDLVKSFNPDWKDLYDEL